MKNKELFDKTIGILVKAYINKGIEHGHPCGCAFGNIVLGNNALIEPAQEEGYIFNPYWWFSAVGNDYARKDSPLYIDKNKGIEQIKKTGYSFEEAAQIEQAFEHIPDADEDEDGYIGLMSVCDALMQIHEANETEIAEAKALFVTA